MTRNLPLTIGALLVSLSFVLSPGFAQEDDQPKDKKEIKGYGFKIEKSIEHTSVKSQDRTGTCWCFAGSALRDTRASL